MRGAGVPLGDGDKTGDLLVTVSLAVPRNLSSKEQAALEAFAELSDESPRRHLFPSSDGAGR